MTDSPKLTARQHQILQLVQHAIARTGAPPTRAEIAAELGFKSANAAEEHLQALARRFYLRPSPLGPGVLSRAHLLARPRIPLRPAFVGGIFRHALGERPNQRANARVKLPCAA